MNLPFEFSGRRRGLLWTLLWTCKNTNFLLVSINFRSIFDNQGPDSRRGWLRTGFQEKKRSKRRGREERRKREREDNEDNGDNDDDDHDHDYDFDDLMMI